ncbi:hypothetical protein M0R89_19115 (plasmid) [Halorussus limi]|uniref:Uncharacterized protein n=1 Tax=Halorussus limi TaxID=2938695 RepID=A0A8U0I1Q7_9EURY|nr:hypothetical protein [Halorussus limi]UPV76644.1 hypothetical protein M0R89_19115 [Halorussus limi]
MLFDDFDLSILVKVLAIIGLLCIASEGYFLATVQGATEFETSVYTAYPFAFWLCFGLLVTVAVSIYAVSTMTHSAGWRWGLVFAMSAYAILFSLPFFRGYRLYGRGTSDILAHFGDIKAILQTGSVPDTLWYPFEHVLVAELVQLGLSMRIAAVFVGWVFTVLYICSIGIAARRFFGDRRALTAGLCAGTPLLFGTYHISLSPSVLSFFWFPMVVVVLELYRRTKSGRYLAVLIVFLVATVFFHPVTALFLVILFVTSSVFGFLFEWWTARPVSKISLNLGIVGLLSLLSWYMTFTTFEWAVRSVAYGLLKGHVSPGEAEFSQAVEASLTVPQLVIRFVQIYGAVFVYLSIGGAFALYLIYRVVTAKQSYLYTYLSLQFFVGFGLAGVFLNVYLIAFSPIRVSRYMIVLAVVLVALLLYRCTDTNAQLVPAIVSIIIIATLLGAGTVYGPNKHLTHKEYQGAEFVLRHHNETVPIRSFSISYKMEEFVFGTDHPNANRKSFSVKDKRYSLPRHLGYGRKPNESTARSLGPGYLVTKQFDRKFHKAKYFTERQQRAFFHHNKTHIRRLSTEPTVMKIYENGGFEAWYVTNKTKS